MKKLSLVFFLLVSLFSCTTLKVGQTPDDIYYSPGSTYVNNHKQSEEYLNYISSQDDAYLRRKVANRNRWESIDDFSYWNDIRYNYYSPFYSPNLYYNPYLYSFYYNPYGYFWNPYIIDPWRWNWFFNSNNPYFRANVYGYYNYGFLASNYQPKIFNNNSHNNLFSTRNKNYNNVNYSNNSTSQQFSNLFRTQTSNPNSGYPSQTYTQPVRTFAPSTITTPSAGGLSGGFKSTGSSTGSSRGGRN